MDSMEPKSLFPGVAVHKRRSYFSSIGRDTELVDEWHLMIQERDFPARALRTRQNGKGCS